MSQIIEQLSDPVGWLVIAGGALQAAACLFKNQIVLRSMLLAGTIHYLAYYFAVASEPLWPAILATSAIAVGNLIGTARVLLSLRRMRRRAVSACSEGFPAGRMELGIAESGAG